MLIPKTNNWLIVSIFAAFMLSAPAAAEISSGSEGRPKIGLALSGGGARGAAHIGVLKVLEEHNIPIDYIAGTSMGALVGGFYASGMSPAELEELITRIDWVDAFDDKIPRKDRSFRRKRDDDLYLVKNKPGISRGGLKFPSGLIDGQKIDLLLKKLTLPVVTVRDFDKLSIPYRAIATDIVTGETVVLDKGDLALAMRASMSIPALFAPREIDGSLLVDGGVSSNLPVDVVRQMGADVVIAVDISTPMSTREELESILGITGQLSNILTRRNTDQQIASLTDEDVFIRPDLGDITTASFDRAGEAIPAGVAAAESVIEKLEQLSISAEDYRAHLAERTRRIAKLTIDEIRIVNRSRLSHRVIAARLEIEAGEILDIEKLEKDLGQIYGLELFESVYYDITVESGRTVLTVTVHENSWGPNYLQFGVAIYEDYEGPNFNLAAAYTRTAVNRLNGEWRTGFQIGREPGIFTEFYQPFFNNLRNFIHVRASASEQVDNVFDADGKKTEELALQSYGGAVAGGRELGTWGEIRAGIIREAGIIKVQVGDPDAPDTDFDTGEAFVQIFIDELDNINFPHSGGTARIRATAGLETLGSDSDYEQGIVEGSYAYSIGRNTGYFRGMYATTRDSNAPYQSMFRLGGFTRLSGLEHNELIGQHAALLSGVIYRNIGNVSLFSFYAGLSIEYGNVFQLEDEIKFDRGIAAGNVFLGVDTFIGPICIGYGRAERDRDNFYLFLGQSLGVRRAWFRHN